MIDLLLGILSLLGLRETDYERYGRVKREPLLTGA